MGRVGGGVVGECFGGMDSRLLGNDGVRWVGMMGVRDGSDGGESGWGVGLQVSVSEGWIPTSVGMTS